MSDLFRLSQDETCLLEYVGEEEAVVVIPETVKHINEKAFANHREVSKVYLNEGLESIGNQAFYKTNIQSVQLPVSLKSIGLDCFVYLTENIYSVNEAVPEIKIDKKNRYLLTDGKGLYSINDDGSLSLNFLFKSTLTKYDLLDNTTVIKTSAFKRSQKLNHVGNTDKLQKIYDGGLYTSKGIGVFTIGKDLVDISDKELASLKDSVKMDSYNGPYYLSTDVKVADGNPKFKSDGGLLSKKTDDGYEAYIDYRQKRSEDPIIAGYVTKIGNGLFANTGITNIELPDSLKIIGENCFDHCSKLKSITIPKSVTKISKNAFAYCKQLNKVIILNPDCEIDENSFVDCQKSKILFEVGEGECCNQLKKMGMVLKEDNPKTGQTKESLFSYKISKNKTVKINEYLGSECEVVVPEMIEGCPVTEIKKDCFRNMERLQKISWPKTINIGAEQFFGCRNLKEVIIAEGVKEIGDKAFRNCESLNEIYLPESIEKTGNDVFTCAKYDYNTWIYSIPVKIIKGVKGSCAQKLAQECKVRFVDINESGNDDVKNSVCTYHLVDDGIAVDYANVEEGYIYIPDEIDGHPVVEISDTFNSKLENGELSFEAINAVLSLGKNIKRIECYLNKRKVKNVELKDDGYLVLQDNVIYANNKVAVNYLDINSDREIERVFIKEGTEEISKNFIFADSDSKCIIHLPDSIKEVRNDSFYIKTWSFSKKNVALVADEQLLKDVNIDGSINCDKNTSEKEIEILLKWDYEESNGQITLNGYSGKRNDVVAIPTTIKGLPVVNIDWLNLRLQTNISLEGESEYLCVKDNVLYSKDMKRLLYIPRDMNTDMFVLPDSVEQAAHVLMFDLPFVNVIRLSKNLKISTIVISEHKELQTYNQVDVICKGKMYFTALNKDNDEVFFTIPITGNDGFNIKLHDKRFDRMKDYRDKVEYALYRLTYKNVLDLETELKYLSYLKRVKKKVIELIELKNNKKLKDMYDNLEQIQN